MKAFTSETIKDISWRKILFITKYVEIGKKPYTILLLWVSSLKPRENRENSNLHTLVVMSSEYQDASLYKHKKGSRE